MNVPIPAIAWLRAYDRAWLRADLVAGLTTAAVVVPQAMAYADIAGLPLAVGTLHRLCPAVRLRGYGNFSSLECDDHFDDRNPDR